MTQNTQALSMPSHIAIIMDGNGRWASQRKLPTIMGHREGASALKRITKHAGSLGVQFLTVYAFSTENWRRPESWIKEMMGLLRYYLKNEVREITKNNVRLKIIGNKSEFDQDIQDLINDIEEQTCNNKGMTLVIALNYGGRTDIVKACQDISKKVASGEMSSDSISEDVFSQHLYTKDIPDPDLLIRSSGEYRISNYLLWQLAYSEFVFSNKLWPEFNEDDLEDAIKQYQTRNRRFGAVIAN